MNLSVREVHFRRSGWTIATLMYESGYANRGNSFRATCTENLLGELAWRTCSEELAPAACSEQLAQRTCWRTCSEELAPTTCSEQLAERTCLENLLRGTRANNLPRATCAENLLETRCYCFRATHLLVKVVGAEADRLYHKTLLLQPL